MPLFAVKLFRFEYWTWWLFYLPLLPYYLWLAFKARSFTFFTAANPGIDAGGFFGEKKSEILKLIDEKHKVKTIFISCSDTFDHVVLQIQKQNIGFPLIVKPDVGERGNGVQKIYSLEELRNLFREYAATDLLIQEFIDFKTELGILYYKQPGNSTGEISSVVIKEFLKAEGDGARSILQLMQQNDRARIQAKRLKKKMGNDIYRVPHEGEEVLLEPIGNHCLGTKFLNGNHLINKKLVNIFDKIVADIPGFYYGRFDLKVNSMEDLYDGKNIRIMELNGVSSDPAHIFHPGYSIVKAYRDLIKHWKIIYRISISNMNSGTPPVSLKEIYNKMRIHFFK